MYLTVSCILRLSVVSLSLFDLLGSNYASIEMEGIYY